MKWCSLRERWCLYGRFYQEIQYCHGEGRRDPSDSLDRLSGIGGKGYNPINQIVGYILSEDPTYITNHNNARTLIRKIDRDELLQVLVRRYLGQ